MLEGELLDTELLDGEEMLETLDGELKDSCDCDDGDELDSELDDGLETELGLDGELMLDTELCDDSDCELVDIELLLGELILLIVDDMLDSSGSR